MTSEPNMILSGLSSAETAVLLDAVCAQYSDVGKSPEANYPFRVGRAFAEALGYPKAVLDQLPASVWEAFTGVAAPALKGDVSSGEKVVDMGCGGGLDLLLLSRAVGRDGRVIGVDFAPGMVQRAQRNIELSGTRNATVVQAAVQTTGLADASVDWVIANGILNLSPDKGAIVAEILRILKPGGHFLLAEITLRTVLKEAPPPTLEDWFR